MAATPTPDPKIMTIEVRLGGQLYREDLSAQAAIELNLPGVCEGLAQNPGRVAWWATLAALAEQEETEAREALEVCDALLMEKQYQQQSALTLMKARVRTDPEHQRLAKAYRAAQHQHKLIRVGLAALAERKASLRELSANMREEMARGLGLPTAQEQARDNHRELQSRVKRGEFRGSGRPLG